MKSIYRLVLVALTGATLTACDFLDREPQINTEQDFYNSEKKVLQGLAGVYGVLNSEELYGHYYSLQISNADDLTYYNNYNSGDTRVDKYNHSASTDVVYAAWAKLYEGIKNANRFMDAIGDSKFDPKGLAYNEARFLRAYYHFLLAQAWGDVPLRNAATQSPNPADVQIAATPQEEVLKWSADEIEATLNLLSETAAGTPSRISRTVAQGILARVYLFMAGESVKSVEGIEKRELYRRAAHWAGEVIASGQHRLNRDYKQVFINMISDQYDTQYRESMWEAEFLGDRTSASQWSNGRIGDLIGLRSQSSASNYKEWACNYSYGYYNGSYRLWQLYWETDRTTAETADTKRITDVRQEWNLPGYNFRGLNAQKITYKDKSGASVSRTLKQAQSMYPTPWLANNLFAMPSLEGLDNSAADAFDTADLVYDPTVMAAVRNAGKWRRETLYEKQMASKQLYTTINFPILRYADVLLMYAEATTEYAGALDALAKECLRDIRTRAGIATNEAQLGDARGFRDLVRNERGRELAFEGLRKWDLIRWGVFVDQMHKAGNNIPTDNKLHNATITTYAASNYANVTPRHVYLPIPTKELAVNPKLRQHPLW